MLDGLPQEFSYDGLIVGRLEEQFPTSAGRFRYMPYRGPGHLKMGEAVRLEGAARCTFDSNGQRFEMVVDGIPEYGVLSVSAVRGLGS